MNTVDGPRGMHLLALKVCRNRSNAYAAMWSVGHLGYHHGSRLRAALQAHLEHSLTTMGAYRQHKRRAHAQPEALQLRKRSKKYSSGSPIPKRTLKRAHPQQSRVPEGVQLLQAAAAGRISQLDQLVKQQGVDVNQQVAPLGRTALHAAAEAGQVACCRHLLHQLGADAYVQDNKGVSALMLAATDAHHEVIKVLLDAGADPFTVDHTGVNALLLAASCGSSESVKLLLHEGFVDADYHNSDLGSGENALLLAAEGGWCECVQQLLKAGAKVNRADSEGKTALWVASRNGHVNVVQLLLAEPRIKHVRHFLTNTTPLQEAQQAGHNTVEALLQAHLCQQQQQEQGNLQTSANLSRLAQSSQQQLPVSVQSRTYQQPRSGNKREQQQQPSHVLQQSKASKPKPTTSSSGVSTMDALLHGSGPQQPQVKALEANNTPLRDLSSIPLALAY